LPECTGWFPSHDRTVAGRPSIERSRRQFSSCPRGTWSRLHAVVARHHLQTGTLRDRFRTSGQSQGLRRQARGPAAPRCVPRRARGRAVCGCGFRSLPARRRGSGMRLPAPRRVGSAPLTRWVAQLVVVLASVRVRAGVVRRLPHWGAWWSPAVGGLVTALAAAFTATCCPWISSRSGGDGGGSDHPFALRPSSDRVKSSLSGPNEVSPSTYRFLGRQPACSAWLVAAAVRPRVALNRARDVARLRCPPPPAEPPLLDRR